MSLKNTISIVVTEDNVKNIKDRLDAIISEHPFISLPLPALDTTRIIGPEREAFVERVIELAKQFPGSLPQDISIVELERDYKDTYKPIRTIIGYYKEHISKLEVVSFAAGSDAMEAIDRIYGVLQVEAGKNKVVKDALKPASDLLKHKPLPPPPADPTNNPPDNPAPTP